MSKLQTSDYVFKYYDTPPNEDVISLVPPNKKILDVGCSSGRLAQCLKEGRGCQVFGVEVDGDLAKKAESFCERVLVTNIEALEPLDYPHGFFDVLLFADVLEHCRNPKEILENLLPYLSSSGIVIISLPNTVNWDIRWRFLLGDFTYRGGTPLDEGHLRFFTLKSAKDMIESVGLSVEKVVTRNRRLKILGRVFPELFAWGFVFKAVPK